jgi:hypothetical protein
MNDDSTQDTYEWVEDYGFVGGVGQVPGVGRIINRRTGEQVGPGYKEEDFSEGIAETARLNEQSRKPRQPPQDP